MAGSPGTGSSAAPGIARQFLGTPYVWGGESPGGFDCSGLVQYVYQRLGIDLPRVSRDQARAGVQIQEASLAPGDLIFSDWEGTPNSHVAIYAGNGRLIEAPQAGDVVHDVPFSANYRRHVTQYRRVGGGGPAAAAGTPAGDAAADAARGQPQGAAPSVPGLPEVGGLISIGNAVQGMAKAAQTIARFFEGLLWLVKPANVLRLLVGGAGVALLAGAGVLMAVSATRGRS